MAFVLLSVAIGALCAFFRYRALIMLPVGALLTVGAVFFTLILGLLRLRFLDPLLHHSSRTWQSVSRTILFVPEG
jgi:hypothetical protein